MRMTINVTANDLVYGTVCNALNCPVARAIINTLSATKVAVGRNTFTMAYKGNRYKGIALPHEATEFIKDFDRGSPIEPFSFEVNISPELIVSPA